MEEKVRKIIANKLGINIDIITPDSSFIDDLGADSLDTLELIMELEEAFQIEIQDEDAEKMKTVGDVFKYLESNIES